ncbi:MAG: RNase P subunit p30 family protein [Candidatus Aenigmatarchaeota archaeon]
MSFYDLHVHTNLSIGENTVEEAAQMAKNLGIGGIGIVRYFNGTKMSELPVVDGIDIVNAVMLKPTSAEELDELAKKARVSAEILMVHGGDYGINRVACENPMIDILCHPELGRKDSGLDHICIRAAEENEVAIEINFREILESYRRHRVSVLAFMRTNIKVCQKYDTMVLTTSGAVSKWGLRAGRELAAITHILGMELTEAIDTISAIPEQMTNKNRERLAGKRWEGAKIDE